MAKEKKAITVDQEKVVGDTAKPSGWPDNLANKYFDPIEVDQNEVVKDDGEIHPVEVDEITEDEKAKFWVDAEARKDRKSKMTEDTMECKVTPITGRLVRPEHDPIVYCAARMREIGRAHV